MPPSTISPLLLLPVCARYVYFYCILLSCSWFCFLLSIHPFKDMCLLLIDFLFFISVFYPQPGRRKLGSTLSAMVRLLLTYLRNTWSLIRSQVCFPLSFYDISPPMSSPRHLLYRFLLARRGSCLDNCDLSVDDFVHGFFIFSPFFFAQLRYSFMLFRFFNPPCLHMSVFSSFSVQSVCCLLSTRSMCILRSILFCFVYVVIG